MASGTFIFYRNGLKAFMNKKIDWETDLIKVALATELYLPDQDAHSFYGDVSNEVVEGLGYVTGGAVLENRTIETIPGTKTVGLKATNTQWTNSTIKGVQHAIVYHDTGDSATSELIGYATFDENMSSISGLFTLDYRNNELFLLTAL